MNSQQSHSSKRHSLLEIDPSIGEYFEDLYDDLLGGPLGQILSCAALLNFSNQDREGDCCGVTIQDVRVEEWSAYSTRSEGAYL